MNDKKNNVSKGYTHTLQTPHASDTGKRLILSIEKKGNGKVDIHMNMWVASKLGKLISGKKHLDTIVEILKNDTDLCGVRFYREKLGNASSAYVLNEVEYEEDHLLLPYRKAEEYCKTLFTSTRILRRIL